MLLGLWRSFLCYCKLRSKSILKTLLDLRQYIGWGVEGERKSGNQHLFISNPGSLLQYRTASLKCTEKPWWENPWLFLLMALYSPLVWCQWYSGLEYVTFACRLPCFLFVILSPHPGSLKQRHGQGALLSIPQLVKLTIPDLPWTVQKANHWLRDQVTTTHRQPLNYEWNKVFGWNCFGQTFPGLWALSVSQRQSTISPAFRVHTMSCCLDFYHECSWDWNAKGIGLISTGKYSCHLNILWNNLFAAVIEWPPFSSAWLFQGSSSRDLEGKRRRGPGSVLPKSG